MQALASDASSTRSGSASPALFASGAGSALVTPRSDDCSTTCWRPFAHVHRGDIRRLPGEKAPQRMVEERARCGERRFAARHELHGSVALRAAADRDRAAEEAARTLAHVSVDSVNATLPAAASIGGSCGLSDEIVAVELVLAGDARLGQVLRAAGRA